MPFQYWPSGASEAQSALTSTSPAQKAPSSQAVSPAVCSPFLQWIYGGEPKAGHALLPGELLVFPVIAANFSMHG